MDRFTALLILRIELIMSVQNIGTQQFAVLTSLAPLGPEGHGCPRLAAPAPAAGDQLRLLRDIQAPGDQLAPGPPWPGQQCVLAAPAAVPR